MPYAAQRAEIERNFEAFESLLTELLPQKAGQFVLMRSGTLIDVYPKAVDALAAGNERFADGKFSVQRVIHRPLDLGFLSYASSERDTN